MTNGHCQLCEKEIDDDGNLFCSQCRKKPFEVRFKCLRNLKLREWAFWDFKGNSKKSKQRYR
jgi:predicted amidophosphoribosyltransferase